MSLANSSSSALSSAHSRHQHLALSAPNSRLPSPPPINTMSEGQPTHVAASSSTTSLVTSPSIANSDSPPPSITDAARSSSPPSSLNGSQSQNGEPFAQTGQLSDVDPQIIEALKSKDRLWVLKMGEAMEGLINDRNRTRIDLTPSNPYQRLLAHRCCTYYKLSPETNPITKIIYVSSTHESRVPQKRIAELVPAEPTTQPMFRIMQRTQLDRKVKPQSSASSVAGEEADLSDVEPSETGSMGGRSATNGSAKKRTFEEREAEYNKARSRIFNEHDEKGKDRDMSASSSSVSLPSVAASNSGGSVGDVDDSASSLPTESERSGPSYNRRSNNISTSSSNRSMRSGFTSNGSGSSRNSRAASPSSSFAYASLYDQAGQAGPPYDPHSQGPYPAGPYLYYPPHPPNAPYPYQFYQYPYSHVPPPSQNAPEGSTPSEVYPPPQPHVVYGPPYIWPPSNQPPIHSAPPMAHQNSNGQIPSAPQSPPQHHPQSAPPQQQYPQYMPPHGYYPMPGYYTPPTGQPMHHAPPPNAPQFYDDTRLMNTSVSGNGENNLYGGGDNQPMRGGAHGNGFNGRNSGRGGHSGGKHRGGGGPTRSPWSYGPGIGMGGVPLGSGNSSSASSTNGEAVAPRFNSSMRRTSNTSAGSSGQYRPSSNDEAASQTSSTSSSSRRTYTSTTSSQQHPLPARPDWAVGLKPDSTLHASSRHHEHSHNGSRNLSPISPPRSLNGGPSHSNSPRPRPNQDQVPQPNLQSNDFPPLSSMSTEKRSAAPAVGGAWNNTATRSLLMTPPTAPGNPVVHHPAHVPPQGPHVVGPHSVGGLPGQHAHVPNDHAIPRLDESNGFERPPPKATELFNPNSRGGGTAKRGRPPNIHQGMGRGNFPPPDVDLALHFGSMSMGGDPGSQRSSTYPPAGLS
ncbi:hypothetical protein PQX77_009732 [Marasmius sp. AFHP31]|nr:hypothetical protein PQX77_009732 [Marasmius sp. AFHP31]